MSNQSKLAALASTGVTKAELNNIDGGTARGTTAVADGDGFLTNDGGTMRMTKVDTLATYMGTKITGGSMVYLASSGVISDAASVVFTQFDATKYDHYQFWTQNIVPVTDNAAFYGYTSTDGGSNYDTGGSDYVRIGTTTASANGYIIGSVGSASGETGITFAIGLHNPHTATKTICTAFAGGAQSSTGTVSDNTAGQFGFYRDATADVDAIKFAFSSGNIESGEIVMYGIANGS